MESMFGRIPFLCSLLVSLSNCVLVSAESTSFRPQRSQSSSVEHNGASWAVWMGRSTALDAPKGQKVGQLK